MMPLTPKEIAFLAHFAFEYMNLQPGPASQQFKSWGLRYLPNYSWLLDAYIGHVHRLGLFDGTVPRPTDRLPPMPWTTAEAVRTRNAELEPEVLAYRKNHKS